MDSWRSQATSGTHDGRSSCDGGWLTRCWGRSGSVETLLVVSGYGVDGAVVCSTVPALCGFEELSGWDATVCRVTA